MGTLIFSTSLSESSPNSQSVQLLHAIPTAALVLDPRPDDVLYTQLMYMKLHTWKPIRRQLYEPQIEINSENIVTKFKYHL